MTLTKFKRGNQPCAPAVAPTIIADSHEGPPEMLHMEDPDADLYKEPSAADLQLQAMVEKGKKLKAKKAADLELHEDSGKFSVKADAIFFTLTHIKQKFGSAKYWELYFPDAVAGWVAWEKIDEKHTNDHCHVFLMFPPPRKTFRRARWKKAGKFFGCKKLSLNIQSWSPKKTYVDAMSGLPYPKSTKGPGKGLWCLEKINYCSCSAMNKSYFPSEKFDSKLATVDSLVTWGGTTALNDVLLEAHTNWMNSPLEAQKIKPAEYVQRKILSGKWGKKDLNRALYPTSNIPDKIKLEILKNKKKYVEMAIAMSEATFQMEAEKEYEELFAKFSPAQKTAWRLLEEQNDRDIAFWIDRGDSGKSYFAHVMNFREDVLFLGNSKSDNFAEAYNPVVHKYIVILCSSHGMGYLNSKGIESLKDGLIFSGKYHSSGKASLMKRRPKVMIFGNEFPYNMECGWRGNRAKYYITRTSYKQNPDQELEFWEHRKNAFDKLIGGHKRKLMDPLDCNPKPMQQTKLMKWDTK